MFNLQNRFFVERFLLDNSWSGDQLRQQRRWRSPDRQYLASMFTHIYRNKLLVAVILLMAFAFPPKKKIKVWLIGDSTMCTYETNKAPITGWGMPFVNFFDSSVVIDNRARGGRSTRTFLSENRWQPIADSLQEGDYVFIQFGHNDEAKELQYAARYTSVPDYKINLIKFITKTRAKKANPVIITPVTRMKFDKDSKQQETHVEYTAACYEIAKQYNVPLIDLDKKSRELLQQFGAENAKLLFMQYEPGEDPHYPEGQKTILTLMILVQEKLQSLFCRE